MKVIHFDSGFGNQISIYAEYLAMKYSNPEDVIYMEDIVYSIPETEEYLAMWQGYELERVFGIKLPNISELFSQEEYHQIISEVSETKFWNDNWNYPPVITEILAKHGLKLKNMCKSNFIFNESIQRKILRKILKDIRKTHLGGMLIEKSMKCFEDKIIKEENYKELLFYSTKEDLFFGQTGYPLYRSAGIEIIEKQLRESLIFRTELSQKNERVLNSVKSCNSVAIHARRGDLFKFVDFCYTNGYFKRATDYIRKQVESPHFFVFSDEGSENWIYNNLEILGLRNSDNISIVNWNKGEDSHIDMYLMSNCKHVVFTKSSFGFWAAWLNKNPNKITCSPDIRINSTNHF